MSKQIDRRRALGVFGAVGLGALVTACGGNDKSGSATGDTGDTSSSTGASSTSTSYAAQPYASDSGRDTFNTDDGIFSDETILTLSKDGTGYVGVINLDVKSA